MNLQSIHSKAVNFVQNTTHKKDTPPAGSGPTTPIDGGGTADPIKKPGSGPVVSSLHYSMKTEGMTQENSTVSPEVYRDTMHGFTSSLFAAVHDQKMADRASGTGNPTMAGALGEIAAQAAAGNAPADLQASFDALQATQVPGTPGASVSLSSLLSGMPQSDPTADPAGQVLNAVA